MNNRIVFTSLCLLLFFAASISLVYIKSGSTVKQAMSTLVPFSDPVIIAHRGASARTPEHTLPAFRKAIEQQADFVEFDLQMTKDGELVAVHDSTLERTTNVKELYPDRSPWAVKNFTLEEIKKLDAGTWFNAAYPPLADPEYQGLQIPTLQEILNLIKEYPSTHIGIYIETKGLGMEEQLAGILQRNHVFEKRQVVLESFIPESLKKLKGIVPEEVVFIQLVDSAPAGEAELNQQMEEIGTYADGVGPSQELISKKYVQAAHRHHLLVHPYNVQNESFIQQAISLGVDGLFTDDPSHLYQLIKPGAEHGISPLPLIR
ncbi:glycerophosphodiester phosphodiesterase family protein [Halobacillus rhizosphaerae]|uniref:glycerophosphodiester phosphodiesterase family protein n=1 Tax=Halobacillus rhizosphaerae TaxID=3064889 RepID=UPI00398A7029